MRKKIILLLLAGALIFIASLVCITAFVLFEAVTPPKLADVNETDFLKMLESRQAVVTGISEVTGPGANSYSVLWHYKNPNPPGNQIECATDWVKGSPDDLMALLKKCKPEGTLRPLIKPALTVCLVRGAPFILFLLAAWAIFRQEISTFFKGKS